MNKTILLLLCTLLCIPLSYAQQERVTFHIDSDTIHLYTFGVYRDSVPADTWYYFGKYGEVIKSRSAFTSMTTAEGTCYSCLERTYALHGDTLSARKVIVDDYELKQRVNPFYDEPIEINRLNKYQALEGFSNQSNHGHSYGYYKNGTSHGLSYYINNSGQLSYLCAYSDGCEVGKSYILPGIETTILTDLNGKDYTCNVATRTCYTSDGFKKVEGQIIYDVSFEIDGEESGIWTHYDKSGRVVKRDTFPDRWERKKVVHRHAVPKNYHGKKHPDASVYLAPVEKAINTRYPEDIWKARVVRLQSIGVKAVQVDRDTQSNFIAICEDLDMIAFVDSTTSTKRKLQGYSNKYGLITLDEQITPAGYYYKAQWSEQPNIYLGAYPSKKAHLAKMHTHMPHHWNFQAGEDITVVAYTNADAAELRMNGQVVGEKKKNTSSRTIEWTIPYQPGDLKVNAYQDGTVVSTDSIYTPGEPYYVMFNEVYSEDGDYYDRRSMRLLVKIADKKERLVYTSDATITCIIRDNLRIMGIENGTVNNFQTDSLHILPVHGGTAKVYLEIIDRGSSYEVSMQSKPLIGQNVFGTNH